jgi:hypothetical protein
MPSEIWVGIASREAETPHILADAGRSSLLPLRPPVKGVFVAARRTTRLPRELTRLRRHSCDKEMSRREFTSGGQRRTHLKNGPPHAQA